MNTLCGPHETGFIEPFRLRFNSDCSEDRSSFPIAMRADPNGQCAEPGTLKSLTKIWLKAVLIYA